jgi:hypothetical protein
MYDKVVQVDFVTNRAVNSRFIPSRLSVVGSDLLTCQIIIALLM